MLRNRRVRIDNLIEDIFVELFKQSTPSGDFKQLIEDNKNNLNERGQIIIPFDDYSLEDHKFDEIISQKIKEHKLHLNTHETNFVRNNVFWGPSPKSIF